MLSALTLEQAEHIFLLLHEFEPFEDKQHRSILSCPCNPATRFREKVKEMNEQEKENSTLFGVSPTRIPVGDVIRAKRVGFGRMEQKRIDLESREDRLAWIHKVEGAITFLQSFRAGAKQSLDIELYELDEESRAKRLQKDLAYKVKLSPEISTTDKKAKQLAAALETLGLSTNDLKKLKG
jgi:hypothetical protein